LGGWKTGRILSFRQRRLSSYARACERFPEVRGGRRASVWPAFKTDVLTANDPGRFGNPGRALLSSPGSFGWDVSLSKVFASGTTPRMIAALPCAAGCAAGRH
jgi:hypothetical protein